MKHGLIYFLLAALVIFSGCSSKDNSGPSADVNSIESSDADVSNPLIRKTLSGDVEGKNAGENTWTWQGIPFAKPPVGDLRWKAPLDPEKWTGVRKTQEYCSICVQYSNVTPEGSNKPLLKGNEDCLFLNVWRPATGEKSLPVFFYIHGGGNIMGGANMSFQDGARFASRNNMVVVSINYRLGILGWFAHPAMREGINKLDDSGNYGTLDQIKALEWVRDNIEQFGGNPDCVTIAGQSGGALNVIALTTCPLAKGLFHGAIAMSGFSQSGTMEAADRKGEGMLLRLLKQDKLPVYYSISKNDEWKRGYLRSKDVEEIYGPAIAGFVPAEAVLAPLAIMGVYIDGTVFKMSPLKAFETGDYNRVPLILGSTKDELKTFLSSALVSGQRMIDLHSKFDFENPNMGLEEIIGPDFKKVLPLLDIFAKIGKILFQGYGVDNIARRAAEHQKDVYAYSFNWDDQPAPFDVLLGAAHALDIPFLFGNFDDDLGMIESFSWSIKNSKGRTYLSNAIMSYFSALARTGDPNTGNSDLPEWQPWSNDPDGHKRIILDANKICMSDEAVDTGLIEEPHVLIDKIAELLSNKGYP